MVKMEDEEAPISKAQTDEKDSAEDIQSSRKPSEDTHSGSDAKNRPLLQLACDKSEETRRNSGTLSPVPVIRKVIQKKKTPAQVRVIQEVLSGCRVEDITYEMRRECEARTGLKWVQVYKWIFDRRKLGK